MKLTKTKLKQLIKEELAKLSEFEEPGPRGELDIHKISDDLVAADDAWARLFIAAEEARIDVSALKMAYLNLDKRDLITQIDAATTPRS